jgi:hypothetical protein
MPLSAGITNMYHHTPLLCSHVRNISSSETAQSGVSGVFAGGNREDIKVNCLESEYVLLYLIVGKLSQMTEANLERLSRVIDEQSV